MLFGSVGAVCVDRNVSASGKTIGAYKNTDYKADKGSDAKTIYNGVKKEDSKYSGEYLEIKSNKITSSKFYDKSRNIKYWASHGHPDGSIDGGSNNPNAAKFNVFDKKGFTWAGGNLEFVFLATCNQLNKQEGNPVKKYANAMTGSQAVRVICGYHSFAPSSGDNMVAKKFMSYAKTGESVKSSWIKANEYVNKQDKITNAAHYAVLTHTGDSQYSRFPGFAGKTYSRPGNASKKIIRFRRSVTNGETIKKAKRKISGVMPMQMSDKNIKGFSVPNYTLKKEDVKFKVNSSCRDMVFHDNNILTLDGGEIGSNAISMGKAEICSDVKEYIADNIQNDQEINLANKDVEIVPIVMDDAMAEDEKGVTVAYSVNFQQKYQGYEVDDNSCTAIIDESGIKNTTLKWSKLTKKAVPAVRKQINYNTALNIVGGQSEPKIGNRVVKKKVSTKNFVNSSIKFVYNKKTDSYEPNYCFVMQDGTEKLVPCYQGGK